MFEIAHNFAPSCTFMTWSFYSSYQHTLPCYHRTGHACASVRTALLSPLPMLLTMHESGHGWSGHHSACLLAWPTIYHPVPNPKLYTSHKCECMWEKQWPLTVNIVYRPGCSKRGSCHTGYIWTHNQFSWLIRLEGLCLHISSWHRSKAPYSKCQSMVLRNDLVFSPVFKLPPNHENANIEGSYNEHPFKLHGISKIDFCGFLRVLYP